MKTKEQILKTALKFFLQKGFYNVSMSMIAAELRISKPAIYHHFNNKDAMVEGVLDYSTEKMERWSEKYFADLESGEDFMERLFQAIPIYKNMELVLLNETVETYLYSYNDLLIILSKYKSDLKLKISEYLKLRRQVFEKNIRRAQDEHFIRPDLQPSRLAKLIHTIIEGSTFICELDPSLKVNVISNEMYQMLWKIIGK